MKDFIMFVSFFPLIFVFNSGTCHHKPRLLNDDEYDLLIDDLKKNPTPTLPKERTPTQRKIYDLRKNYHFQMHTIYNPLTNLKEYRPCIADGEKWLLYPRLDEVDKIIGYFYHQYKGEGPKN